MKLKRRRAFEVPPKIRSFINNVTSAPLEKIEEPLKGFTWEYDKGDFHHWVDLFTHFDTYFEKCVDDTSKEIGGVEQQNQGLQVIHLPNISSYSETDLELLNKLVTENKVSPNLRLYAFIVLVQSSGDADDLASFFNNEPEFVNELVSLLSYEDAVPEKIRILGVLSLVALCQDRTRQSTVLTSVTSGGHRGILPSLMQKAISSIAAVDSSRSIIFAEALLSLVTILVSSSSGCTALREAGLIPTLLPLLKDTNPQHLHLVSNAVHILEAFMDYSNPAAALFRDLGGLDDTIARLKVEVSYVDNGPKKHEEELDYSRKGKQSLYSSDELDVHPLYSEALVTYHRRLLMKALLRAISLGTYAPGNTGRVYGSEENLLPHCLCTIFRRAKEFGGGVFSLAATVMSDLIHKDPTCFPVLEAADLPSAFLDAILGGVLCSAEAISCIPQCLDALCLNNTGLQAVKDRNALRCFVKIFTSRMYLRALSGDTPGSLSTGLDELMRHASSLRGLGVDMLIEILNTILKIGSEAEPFPSSIESSMSSAATPMETDQEEGSLVSQDEAESSRMGSIEQPLESSSDGSSINVESFLPECISNVARLLEAVLQNADTCRLFIEKKGVEAVLQLFTLPLMPYSASIGQSVPVAFKNFSPQHSVTLARAVCTFLREQLMLANELLDSVSGIRLAELEGAKQTKVLKSLSSLEGLLSLSNFLLKGTTTMTSELGSADADVLNYLERAYKEVQWQISLISDSKADEKRDAEQEVGIPEATVSNSAGRESDDDANLLPVIRYMNPASVRHGSAHHWSEVSEQEFLSVIRSGDGMHRHGRHGLSRSRGGRISRQLDSHIDLDSSLSSLEMSPLQDVKKKSPDVLVSEVLNKLASAVRSFHSTLAKGFMGPRRRADSTSSSRSIAASLAKYFMRLSELLATYGATSQLLWTPSYYISTSDVDQGKAVDGNKLSHSSWLLDTLQSYCRLLEYFVSPSLLLSQTSSSHAELLVQPFAPELSIGLFPVPKDAGLFIRLLQSQVLDVILPVWNHPMFPNCHPTFITSMVSVITYIYSGVGDVKPNRNGITGSTGQRLTGPPLDEGAIAIVVEMGFSRARAEEAFRHVGSNSIELATDWLFSHPEESLQENEDMKKAVALSLGNSSETSKEDIDDSTKDELAGVAAPPVDDILAASMRLFQCGDSMAFPLTDLLVTLCNRNKGEDRQKVALFLIQQLKLCSSEFSNEMGKLFSASYILALLLSEDSGTRDIAAENGIVSAALDILSNFSARKDLREGVSATKCMSALLLILDHMLQPKTKVPSESAEGVLSGSLANSSAGDASLRSIESDVDFKSSSDAQHKESCSALEKILGKSTGRLSLEESQRTLAVACDLIKQHVPAVEECASSSTPMEVDESSMKEKGKSKVDYLKKADCESVSERSAELAKVTFVLKLMSDILLMYVHAMGVVLKRDSETSQLRISNQADGLGHGGLLHHILNHLLPISSDKSSDATDEWKEKLSDKASWFLVVLCGRSSEGRRRVIYEIVKALSSFENSENNSSKNVVLPNKRVLIFIDLVNSILSKNPSASNLPSPACSPDVAKTMIDGGMVKSLTSMLQVLDLDHPGAPKVVDLILKALESLTRVANASEQVFKLDGSNKKKSSGTNERNEDQTNPVSAREVPEHGQDVSNQHEEPDAVPSEQQHQSSSLDERNCDVNIDQSQDMGVDMEDTGAAHLPMEHGSDLCRKKWLKVTSLTVERRRHNNNRTFLDRSEGSAFQHPLLLRPSQSGDQNIPTWSSSGNSSRDLEASSVDPLHVTGRRGTGDGRWTDDCQPQAGSQAAAIAQAVEEQFISQLRSMADINSPSSHGRLQNAVGQETENLNAPTSIDDGHPVVVTNNMVNPQSENQPQGEPGISSALEEECPGVEGDQSINVEPAIDEAVENRAQEYLSTDSDGLNTTCNVSASMSNREGNEPADDQLENATDLAGLAACFQAVDPLGQNSSELLPNTHDMAFIDNSTNGPLGTENNSSSDARIDSNSELPDASDAHGGSVHISVDVDMDSLDAVGNQAESNEPPAEQNTEVPQDALQADDANANNETSNSSAIDPTFLEALPEDLRAEVLASQQAQPVQIGTYAPPSAEDIDPEFLAALPPDIQAEVLAQQRAQRISQSQQAEGQPVDMDNASILATFPPDLREEVLLSSSEAFLSALPSPLLAEAQMLRANRLFRGSQRLSGRRNGIAIDRQAVMDRGVGASIGRRPVSGFANSLKVKEMEGTPLLDPSAVKALLRLLRLAQLLAKSCLQRLFLNLCAHRGTRAILVSLLLDMIRPEADGCAAVSVTPTSQRLYGCQWNVVYGRSQLLDGLPPLVSRRILEVLTCLATNHISFANLLFYFDSSLVPESAITTRHENNEKDKGKTVEGLSGSGLETSQKGDIPLILFLKLLNRPLFLRSNAHLEQVMVLVQVVVNSAVSKIDFEPLSESLSTQNDDEKKENGSTDAPSSSGKENVNLYDIFLQLPKSELRNLCNILAHEGLSEKVYTLAAEVVKKLASVAASHRKFFASELADLAHNLSGSAVGELVTLRSTHMLGLSAGSMAGSAILRVLQALHALTSAIDGIKKQEIEGEQEEQTIMWKLNGALEPLWQELSDCITMMETKLGQNSTFTSPMSSPNIGDVIGGASSSSPPLPPGTQRLLPFIEAFFVLSEKLQTNHLILQTDNNVTAREVKECAGSSSASSVKPGVAVQKRSDGSMTFARFADKHRRLLNAFIRQNPGLLEKSLSIMLKAPRLIDFDNKRAYFRSKIRQQHEQHPSAPLRISVRRAYVLEDSYNQLRMRSTQDLKGRLTVQFQGEEGIDAGGLTREWYQLLSRVIFDKGALLFTTVGNNTTFQPNPNSVYQTEHLSYFKFVGRVVAKALFDGQLLDVYFTRSFYKHILGVKVTYHDIEAVDPDYYKNLKWMLENDVSEIPDLTFSMDADEEKHILYEKTEVTDYELKPGGRNIRVTEETKHEYVDLVAEHILTNAIRPQINSFLEGFNELVPRELISIFNDKELELLISGLPEIDFDDLQANTEYTGYTAASSVVQWFWEVAKAFNKEDMARLLQFVTGTSKVPLEGFKALQGISGPQRFQIHKAYGAPERLPSAHTCFNQLDIPEYSTKEQLRERLLLAIHEASEGFGFG
ncbi:E3 ubiquitin-protein ligase UPL1 [Acorus calamus]|uniref:HECT-type E3 ubiquitin transferase n=1 Tax=Acorus calamus TaxID=4465 RepID=A0AAV9E9H8_ACOCL|nr:E3 ubiquitin-protein ligase UPL1 [Acorus calamus]